MNISHKTRHHWDHLNEDDLTWTTAKGEKLLIDEMDIMHVFYTVKKLKRENAKIIPKRLIERYNNFKETRPEYFL